MGLDQINRRPSMMCHAHASCACLPTKIAQDIEGLMGGMGQTPGLEEKGVCNLQLVYAPSLQNMPDCSIHTYMCA